MLKGSIIHAQTIRASVGQSFDVFTLRRQPTYTRDPPASDTHTPKRTDSRKTASAAPTPHKTQTARPHPYPADKLTRGRPPRRRTGGVGRPDAQSPAPSDRTLSPPGSQQPSANAIVRAAELESANLKADLARAQLESAKYAERCRLLERALRDATDRLLAREREVEELKRERMRLIADRERERGRDRERERERERAHLARSQTSATLQSAAVVSRRKALSPTSSSRTAVDSIDDDFARQRSRTKSTPSGPVPPLPIRSRSANPPPDGPTSVPGLDVFLTKVDRWSGAQVIEAVQDLNSEILQLAAAATEAATVARDPVAPPARVAQARRAVAARLGVAFAQALGARNHASDLTLVQFALQTCITTCTARMLGCFCIGLPPMPNELFAQLYDDVRETEPQATSSRWRALTLSHIRSLNPQLEELAVSEFVTVILRAWADVFVLCSCASSGADGITLTSPDALRARFGRQAARIAATACKLARVVKEEIMSTNFELLFVEQGAPFVGDAMTNAYAGAGVGGVTSAGAGVTARGAVLCTTELGLQCLTRRRAKGEDEEDRTVERTLLLPKVILESVSQVLDGTSTT